MRDIKFRAWDSVTNEWVRFDKSPVHSVGGKQTIGVLEGSDGVIFMQFTGLKDKNGKEIYEGDICLTHLGGDYPGYQRVVKWEKDRPQLKFNPEAGSILCEGNMQDTQVIGNIYENPELLKVIKDNL